MQTLNETGSGGSITNIQQTINNNTELIVAEELITALGTISSHVNRRRQSRDVAGSTAPRTASTTPFGTGGTWDDGIVITLNGTNNTNTLTLTNNDIQYGAILNGGITLKKYHSVELRYNASLERWIEKGRNT